MADTSDPQPPAIEPAALTSPTADASKAASIAQNITPWEVEGAVVDGKVQAIDYNNLLDQFGTKRIDATLLERFEKVTGHKPHILLRRGMFFSHRDLETILDKHEKGKPFFLYTGRGPSSESMHMGHMIPFTFTKYDRSQIVSN